MLRLESPAQQRSLASIIAPIPDDQKVKLAQSLVRLELAFERQHKQDAAIASGFAVNQHALYQGIMGNH